MGPEREGALARAIADGIHVFDRPLRVFGLHVGTRMTAVRLPDGGLWLHSPVEPDAPTRAELDALGPVRFAVAPNKLHHFFVGAYREAYPEARLFAAPGLPEKKRRLRFDGVLGDAPEPAWADALDQCLVGGMPHLNEVVFLHRASGTLLLTDLGMNPVDTPETLTRWWWRAMGLTGRFGASRLVRRLVRDRAAARAGLERILAWDFERIVVTHGVVLQRQAKRQLREAYGWLLDG